jgi:5-methylcytosine-specific restriction protein A
MPTTPPTRCAHPDCHTLTTTGRCTEHTRKPWQDANQHAIRTLSSRITRTRRWRNIRTAQLKDHPLCATCGHIATEVDHIIPLHLGGAPWTADNRQSLCAPCHAAKSAAERAAARQQATA